MDYRNRWTLSLRPAAPKMLFCIIAGEKPLAARTSRFDAKTVLESKYKTNPRARIVGIVPMDRRWQHALWLSSHR
jgi:hypothetical protein